MMTPISLHHISLKINWHHTALQVSNVYQLSWKYGFVRCQQNCKLHHVGDILLLYHQKFQQKTLDIGVGDPKYAI